MIVGLKRKESIPASIERVVRKRLDSARELLASKPGTMLGDEAIHDARKKLKRLRALIRLVRDDLGPRRFRYANLCLRNASRPLSELRDARVLIDTLDSLHGKDRARSGSFTQIRSALAARRHRRTTAAHP